MEIKIEITNGSSEQQEAHMSSWFTTALKEFIHKSNDALGMRCINDDGLPWDKQTLLFTNDCTVLNDLEVLKNQKNKINRKISALKKANPKENVCEKCSNPIIDKPIFNKHGVNVKSLTTQNGDRVYFCDKCWKTTI